MVQLLDLPHEVLTEICFFLDPVDLCRISRSCSALRAAAEEENVWRGIVGRSVDTAAAEKYMPGLPWTWKERYRTLLISSELPDSENGTRAVAPAGGEGWTLSLFVMLLEDAPNTQRREAPAWRTLAVRLTADSERLPALLFHPYDCSIVLTTTPAPIESAEGELERTPIRGGKLLNNRLFQSDDELPLFRWAHLCLTCKFGPAGGSGDEVGPPACQYTVYIDGRPVLNASDGGPVPRHYDPARLFVGCSVPGTRWQPARALVRGARWYMRPLDEGHVGVLASRPPAEGEAGLAAATLPELRRAAADAQRAVVHDDFGCDVCNQFPIEGVRYACRSCRVSYDLCARCHAANAWAEGRYASTHTREHVFRTVRRSYPSIAIVPLP
eukprot:tig00020675_g12680.t1